MADVDGCTPFREGLAEVALGVVDLAEVPELEAHLVDCPTCRVELVDLAATVDQLVLGVPGIEPPSGFAARALTAMALARSPAVRMRRRLPRRLAATAVVLTILAIAGLVCAWALGSGTDPPHREAVAPLVARDGAPIGRVKVIASTRPTMTVWISRAATGRRYTCEVVMTDGSRTKVAAWTAWARTGSWTVALPDGTLRRVELLDAGGTPVATAIVDT